MSAASRNAITDEGTHIIPCPGCGANPVRSHPTIEELRVESNWTRTCPRCRRKVCVVCYPVCAAACALTDCESMADVLGVAGAA